MFWKRFKKSADTNKPVIAEHKHKITQIDLPLSFLEKLIPIGDLPSKQLQSLPVTARHFEPGAILFNRGDDADELIYLQHGEVFLEAADGQGYCVEDSVFKACYPLSGHTQQHFTAIAKSSVSALYIPTSALPQNAPIAPLHNPLLSLKNLPPELKLSAFFNGFCEAFQNEQLHVPTLPDVALRLRRALQQDISISDASKIVNLDPLIAAKLIQVANSPLYPTTEPLTNSHDAMTRLGLQTTQNLVTSISLHNLFRSNNPRLNHFIQQQWKHSIHIASLSYVLATQTRKINPDEALLAGLIHNLGALPVITFAERLDSNDYNDQQLMATINALQGFVGSHILTKWHFPERLQVIPLQTSNWYHNENPQLQLSDIVLLARFHHLLGQPQASKLPPINTLPAFNKLGKTDLSPDLSLQILLDAKQQIAEAMSFFKA